MQAERTTCLDLLRHGEPVGGSRYRGHGVDDPLSELGWSQMWAAVDGGQQAAWSCVVSSPMQRCLAFARAFAERQRLSVDVLEDLKEIGFGSWEGRSRDELKRERPEEYAAFNADPLRARPAGAEPLESFAARVSSALAQVANTYAGERVLVVAHAGVLRVAVAWTLQSPLETLYRLHIPFAGRVRLRIDGNAKRLEFI